MTSPQKWRGTQQLLATFALGPDSHIDADWTTCESELLTKPPLDEATVVCLEESGRKQHECGWRHACLRAEEDARLLTSVDTLPMTGGQGVAGSNPVSPTVKTLVDDHKSSARVLSFSARGAYGGLTGRAFPRPFDSDGRHSVHQRQQPDIDSEP